jgi:hypothetical protein
VVRLGSGGRAVLAGRLEFGLLGAGAAVLGVTGLYQWVPVSICFGVGVHFFPLAQVLENPSLNPLGCCSSPSPWRPW